MQSGQTWNSSYAMSIEQLRGSNEKGEICCIEDNVCERQPRMRDPFLAYFPEFIIFLFRTPPISTLFFNIFQYFTASSWTSSSSLWWEFHGCWKSSLNTLIVSFSKRSLTFTIYSVVYSFSSFSYSSVVLSTNLSIESVSFPSNVILFLLLNFFYIFFLYWIAFYVIRNRFSIFGTKT